MSEVVEGVSKDVRCETEEKDGELYMVCRDKDNNVVYRRKLVSVSR